MFEQDTVAISHLVAIKNGWSEPQRRGAHADYLDYLAAAAVGGAGRPTLDVDALWHEHMLHSTSYVRFCEHNFGRYIHHVACLPSEVVDDFRARLGGAFPDFIQVAPDGGPGRGEANCGAPEQPDPEPGDITALGRRTSVRYANCGDPVKRPGVAHGRGDIRRANCGADEPLPPDSVLR